MLNAILVDNNKSERLVLKKFLPKISDIVTVTAEFDGERELSVDSHSKVLMMKDLSQIMVQTAEKVVLKQAKDIIMVTRNNRKTDICTTTGIVKTNESLERLETILGEQFFRCHKGYIINISKISELVPWGKKTMMVRFLEYEDTALMTNDRFKEFRKKYFLE